MAPTTRRRDDAPSIPLVPWHEFKPRFRWNQGEHVSLIGPTGQGKTTLGLQLLDQRGWTAILGTKPKDSTLAPLVKQGHTLLRRWPPPNDQTQRVIVWPRYRSMADRSSQAAALREALGGIFVAGSWCVFCDDVQYLTDELRMGDVLRTLWLQARSIGVSVVAATQRPRHAPREMFNQASHLFIWRTNDEDDLRSLGGLGGLSSRTIRSAVADLPRYHALYINTRDGSLAITKAPKG